MPRQKTFDEQLILEKAMNLFWQKGYYATSIQDLVNHLGINRASLYSTFGDKKALFLKAFKHYRVINQKVVEDFFKLQNDVRSGLSSFFDMAIDDIGSERAQKGCFVVNTITEMLPDDPTALPMIAENQEQFTQIFKTYLEHAQQKGQLDATKDTDALATLLFTLYNGLKVVTKVDADKAAFKRSVEAFLKLLD